MCKTKNNTHVLITEVCFLDFSVKRKENYLHRKYRLLVGSSFNFTDQTKYMIYLSSYLIILFLCLISFLLFPWPSGNRSDGPVVSETDCSVN